LGRAFFAEDLIIFDEALNWGSSCFLKGELFYGTEKIYDKEFEHEKTKKLNELK